MEPTTYQRKILLAVTGLAPQIVTETLYGLVTAKPPFIPDEIHIITTAEGAERAKLTLLSKEPGWFYRLLKDYNLPNIQFSEQQIHVAKDSNGIELTDIRTPKDNEQVANFITEHIRQLTERADTALHVSIAGGRKTMGFYLGYALSLYGRPQDRLSHVLVSSPFESNPGFFYPTPESHIIHTHPPDSRPLDTHKAEVTLAEIPFVRLRQDLPTRMISKSFSFQDTVEAAQQKSLQPKLQINMEKQSIKAGEERLYLSPAEFAFYSWLAKRAHQQQPPIRWTDEGLHQEYLAHYQRIVGEMSGDYERVKEALKNGMTKEYFDQRKSKTNGALKDALGERAAEVYLIRSFGTRPRSRFGLGVPPEQIAIT